MTGCSANATISVCRTLVPTTTLLLFRREGLLPATRLLIGRWVVRRLVAASRLAEDVGGAFGTSGRSSAPRRSRERFLQPMSGGRAPHARPSQSGGRHSPPDWTVGCQVTRGGLPIGWGVHVVLALRSLAGGNALCPPWSGASTRGDEGSAHVLSQKHMRNGDRVE